MDNSMDRYLGQMLDDRYELLEVIGYGGMAVVYKALCHVLNRHVAVKILKDEYANDLDFREHFKAESRAVAMLSHPNIVSVYDYSKSPDCQYIVMELLEGITLKQYMQKKGALSWKESLHFATQTAKALSHAHEKGIVHRDIKPQNIMVGKDGNIKVADFGIAHLQNESDPDSSETMGSIHYISPEQARGEPVNARSDIYSLGVVMYEMLTGQLPYEGDSVETIALQHFSSALALPGDINPDIPMRFEQITLKAMASDLNSRYQSADQLLEELEDFRRQQLSGENLDDEVFDAAVYNSQDDDGPRPINRAGELSKKDYARRKIRSRKVSTLLGILLVLLFLTATGVFLWQFWLSDLFNDPERIIIPQFVGEQFDEIYDNPIYRDYYNFKVTYEVNSEYLEGTIIYQNPAAGRKIAPTSNGIDMEVIVSTGILMVEIPSVINYEYREATITLEKLGFIVKLETVASADFTEDYVVRTNPSAGEKMPTGSTIYVYVSGGPIINEFEMPDLTGKSRDEAIVIITEHHLTLGGVTEAESTVAEGKVIWQNVKAGEMVTKNTVIYLTVSSGMPEETPPPESEEITSPPVTSQPPASPPVTVDPQPPADGGTTEG